MILARLDQLDWNRSRLASEAGVSVRLVSHYFAGRDVQGDKLLAMLAATGFRVVPPRGLKLSQPA